MTNQPTELSTCCNQPTKVVPEDARDGQTVYWECTKCRKACDIKPTELSAEVEKRYWKEIEKNDDAGGQLDHQFALAFVAQELATADQNLVTYKAELIEGIEKLQKPEGLGADHIYESQLYNQAIDECIKLIKAKG